MHWIKPKNAVRAKAAKAIKNGCRWAPFLLSYHHCDSVFGSASSKTCLRITRRSRQNRKLSICRASALRWPHFVTFSSIVPFEKFRLNQLFVAWSDSGKTKARDLSVSSIKPVGNTELCQSQIFQKVSRDGGQISHQSITILRNDA